MIKLYLSSVETEYKQIDRMFSRGYPSYGVQVSYIYLRKANYLLESVKKWNVDYKVRCYVTSGLEGKDRNFSKSSEISKILSSIGDEEYGEEYTDWLIQNAPLYENAFEYYHSEIDGAFLSKLRKKYIESGIAKHIIMFVSGTAEVKDAIQSGFQWFVIDNDRLSESEIAVMVKEIDEAGGFVHLNNLYSNLLEMKENVESVSTSAWTQGSRTKQIFFMKFGRLKIYEANEPDALNACLQDKFWNIIPDDVRKKIGTNKSMHYINLWNAYQIQLYIDHLNDRIPAYKEYLKKGGEVPEFANGKDSIGRDKIKEIAKFKSPSNAVFSRGIMDYGLQCNSCIIRDKCPVYKKDSVCAYTEVWTKTGALNTRNTEAIIDSLEKLIEEQNQRLIRGQFIESVQGGTIKKDVTELQNSLVRNIDILYKLKFGSINQNKYNIINLGSTQMLVGNSDDVLAKVRKDMDGNSSYVESEANDGGNSQQ